MLTPACVEHGKIPPLPFLTLSYPFSSLKKHQSVPWAVISEWAVPQGRVPCLCANSYDRMLVAHGLAGRMPQGPVNRRLRTHHWVIATADMRSITQPPAVGHRVP
jgi:hypothetical protein